MDGSSRRILVRRSRQDPAALTIYPMIGAICLWVVSLAKKSPKSGCLSSTIKLHACVSMGSAMGAAARAPVAEDLQALRRVHVFALACAARDWWEREGGQFFRRWWLNSRRLQFYFLRGRPQRRAREPHFEVHTLGTARPDACSPLTY